MMLGLLLAPFLAARVAALSSWNEVKTLQVRIDRLERRYRPGLLLIGDAAHAMSPVGGVGINLAIQERRRCAPYSSGGSRRRGLRS